MQLRSSVQFGRTARADGLAYSDEYYTPPAIVASLGTFDLDPCAGPSQHARRNITPPADGLAIAWRGRVWLNPPYSNVHLWLDRFMEHGNGIALVNARPDAAWWQKLAERATALLFIAGRVKFLTPGGEKRNPPVGSVLVVYGCRNAEALRTSGLAGLLVVPVACEELAP